MAVNVTVRDVVNFPGGTAKTITVDIIQIVPKGSAEGDELWFTSSTTTATASGGGSIQSLFKNEIIRGFIRSSGLIQSSIFNIPATARMEVAIDEDIGSGVDITLTQGNNILGEDVAQDIETQIQNQAVIGGGGGKIGNLSYLNAQVRFTNGRFSIESGTVGDTFTGTNKSSVAVGAPASGTDVRATLGFDITTSSETLAGRQIAETDVTTAYSTGDVLIMRSTTGLTIGDAFLVTDGTNTSSAIVSGTLSASQVRFTTASGLGTGLDNAYAAGSMVRKLQEVDVANPVSAVTTVDELFRFQIDSQVQQIDFSA